MQGTIQNYTLEMTGEKKREPLRVKQFDTNSRWARISLKAFGEPWLVPVGCRTYINIRKSDNTVIMSDCEIEGKDVVLAPITEQATAIPGIQQAELYFLTIDGDIKSQTFPIQVLPAIMDQRVIESSNEFGTLQTTIIGAQEATRTAQDAAAEAMVQAGEARDAAEIAIDAAASIDTAVEAAAAAKTSETNAKASEEAAARTKVDVEALKVGFAGYDKIESGRKYANALTTTADGEGQLTVTDAWDAPVVDMEIDGGSKQVTTTGAQLLDIKLPTVTTKSGVTVSLAADGGIRLNGTATDSGNHRLIDPVQNLSINCDSATLSLQASGAYDGVVMVSDAAAGEWKNLLSVKNNATATGTAKTSKLGCYVTYVAGTTYNVTLYPMLCAGPTAQPWEPYTGGQPSPSPAYPQEIKGVEHVVNSGAQLFDGSKLSVSAGIDCTVAENGKTIIVSGSKAFGNATTDIPIYLIAGKKIYLSSEIINANKNIRVTAQILTTEADGEHYYSLDTSGVQAISVPQDVQKASLKLYPNNTVNPLDTPNTVTFRNIMVSYDASAVWEPYNDQQRKTDLQVDVTGENLFDASKVPSMSGGGATVTNNGDGSFAISGSGTVSGNYDNTRVLSAEEAAKIFSKPGSYTFSGGASVPYMAVNINSPKGIIADAALAKVNKKTFSLKQEDIDMIKDGTARVRIGFYSLADKTIIPGTVRPMINFGGTVLPWEPYYTPQTVTIPLELPSHGIGDVRDKIDIHDGVWGIERRFGTQVFDGSADEAWVAVLNNDGINYRNGTSFVKSKTKANGAALCTALIKSNVVNSIPGFKIAGDASIITYSEVYNTSDVSLWTAHLAEHPMTVVYELVEPIWEPFPAEPQTALNALTTHPGTTYLTVASTDVAAPVRFTYVQDTRKVVDSLKLDLAEQITDLQAQIDQIRVTNNLA